LPSLSVERRKVSGLEVSSELKASESKSCCCLRLDEEDTPWDLRKDDMLYWMMSLCHGVDMLLRLSDDVVRAKSKYGHGRTARGKGNVTAADRHRGSPFFHHTHTEVDT
jgi:hypothetical protein